MSAPARPEGPSRRALRALREDDARTFALKLLSELGYRRVHLLARALERPVAIQPTPGLEVAMLAPGALVEYATLRPDTPRDALTRRVASGHQCFVLREQGRIVSACWSATREAWSDFLGCNIALDPGDVYFFDAFTALSHRGRDLAPLLCAYQLRYFRDDGYKRAVRATVPENSAALRAHAKSGFVPVAMIGRVQVGPWRRDFRRDYDAVAGALG